MSNLKILVCTLLFAATSWTASTAVADHGWPSNQNSGCGRSGGYPGMSGGYGRSGQAYVPQNSSNFGGYTSPWNHNSGIPQGYNNYGPSGYAGSAYRGPQVPNRGTAAIYDSVHGDYHNVPGNGLQQYNTPYRLGQRNSNSGYGINLNLGW